MTESPFDPFDLMVVSAARALSSGQRCFVGIGGPSAAANLARALHAPDLVLIYESGCIGAKPDVLPLSIGDGELADTADLVVSVPEIFNYWLQPGRIDVGFLGAAQIDRFGNLNSTVLGPYDRPETRLPGAGGAPEIAASCCEFYVMMSQSTRTFVEDLDFRTSVGFGEGYGDRARMGIIGAGPSLVITDLGILSPRPDGELELSALQPGVDIETARAATSWDLKVASHVTRLASPTNEEIKTLRRLQSTSVSV